MNPVRNGTTTDSPPAPRPAGGGRATAAAKLAHDLKLAMADAIILATAREYGATLWTQGADFATVAGVRYQPRP